MKTGNASDRLLAAVEFAVAAHGEVRQERKGTTFPYAVHPLRVGEILHRHGYPEDVVVAGLLHDTLEDTRTSFADLEREFGGRVAGLVRAVSEPDKSRPWQERKAHALEHLRSETDPAVLAVAAADKLDSVRSIKATLDDVGPERTWARFQAGEGEQRRHYRALAALFAEKEPSNRLFQTLQLEVDAVFLPEAAGASCRAS